jgi:small-conductance mechanosensitive channel
MIVPNTSIVDANVINYTLNDRLYRLRCPVGVVYSSDMKEVRQVLEGAAAGCTWRVEGKAPVVLLTEFADSAVVWETSVWIEDPWAIRRRMSQLNETLWFALQEAGIVIAFPQVDVHLDPPVMETITSWRKAG